VRKVHLLLLAAITTLGPSYAGLASLIPARLLSSQLGSPVVVTKGDPMVGWRGGHDRDAAMSWGEGPSFQPPSSHVLQANDALAAELKQARERELWRVSTSSPAMAPSVVNEVWWRFRKYWQA
jgi:hypothetical protein